MALRVSIFQYLTDLASICFFFCVRAFTLELVFIAVGSIRAIGHDEDFREARVGISLIATIVIEVLITIAVRNLIIQHLFCSLLRRVALSIDDEPVKFTPRIGLRLVMLRLMELNSDGILLGLGSGGVVRASLVALGQAVGRRCTVGLRHRRIFAQLTVTLQIQLRAAARAQIDRAGVLSDLLHFILKYLESWSYGSAAVTAETFIRILTKLALAHLSVAFKSATCLRATTVRRHPFSLFNVIKVAIAVIIQSTSGRARRRLL